MVDAPDINFSDHLPLIALQLLSVLILNVLIIIRINQIVPINLPKNNYAGIKAISVHSINILIVTCRHFFTKWKVYCLNLTNIRSTLITLISLRLSIVYTTILLRFYLLVLVLTFLPVVKFFLNFGGIRN